MPRIGLWSKPDCCNRWKILNRSSSPRFSLWSAALRRRPSSKGNYWLLPVYKTGALHLEIQSSERTLRINPQSRFLETSSTAPRNCLAVEGLILRKPDKSGSARLSWARENSKPSNATRQQGF